MKEGSPVKKGFVIGKTGRTGLAKGDHLHFEIRVAGIPVWPREWLDAKWVAEHIDQKIIEVKGLLSNSTK